MEKLEQIEFDIRGMTCDSCALHVERALKKVSGVQKVEVPGWNSGQASVLAEEGTDSQALIESIRQAGYGASLKTRQPVGERQVEEPGSSEREGDRGFDLMVIGGGSAGFAAAIKGAESGHRVALVEAGTIGGTCVNVGCVPSKTLIRAMEQYHQAGMHRFQGVETAAGRLVWPVVINNKDKLVGEMRQSRYVDVLAAYPEITYIQGRARLTGENGVEIDGKAYTPGKIVIASGARPWAPPIPGLKEAGYLTSTTAMELKELPHSLIVLGANAVGLELACRKPAGGACQRPPQATGWRPPVVPDRGASSPRRAMLTAGRDQTYLTGGRKTRPGNMRAGDHATMSSQAIGGGQPGMRGRWSGQCCRA